MTIREAIAMRHSVRSYLDKPIEQEKLDTLNAAISECNEKSGLDIQLVVGEPKAFDSIMAHYGKFGGVQNYIAIIGKPELEEEAGYYGEHLVLLAQTLGLNTCWVAMSMSKSTVVSHCEVESGEKLLCVIAIGYGVTQGVPHASKPIASVVKKGSDMPEWFICGVKSALLAPTALNQQRFVFALENGKVSAKAKVGFYTRMDLGIAKYHFEVSVDEPFEWAV